VDLPADLMVAVDGNNSLKRMAFGDKQTDSFPSKFRLPEAQVESMRVEQEHTRRRRLAKGKARQEEGHSAEEPRNVGVASRSGLNLDV